MGTVVISAYEEGDFTVNRKILYVNEGITLANHFVLCMFFFVVAQVLLLGDSEPWYYQLLFFVYLAFAVAIRLLITDTFFIFLGLHIFLFCSVYFIPMNLLLTIECTIYLFILTCQSISFWKQNGYRQNTSLPWPSLLAMFCFYIYAIFTHREHLCLIIYIMGTVYLLLYLAKLYTTGLYKMATSKISVSRLPLAQIVKTNSSIVGLIIGIIAITILLANIFNLDETIHTIVKCFLILLHYISAGIAAFFSWIYNLLFSGASESRQAQSSLAEVFANLKPSTSLLATIIEIIFYIFQCIVFGLLIFWIIRGMYRMIKLFLMRNLQTDDTVEGLSATKRDDLVFVITETEPLPEKTPRSRVRRRYKKAVQKHAKDIALHAALTTNEIAERLPERERIKMEQLKASYEAARYYNDKGEQ